MYKVQPKESICSWVAQGRMMSYEAGLSYCWDRSELAAHYSRRQDSEPESAAVRSMVGMML